MFYYEKLIEKCLPVNEELTLPSKCYMVKVTVACRLYNLLMSESNNLKAYGDDYDDNDDSSIDDSLLSSKRVNMNEIETDLVMDILPEATRFTSNISVNELTNNYDIDLDTNDVDNLNENENGLDYKEHETTQDLTVYVQSNSRLKLILLMPNESAEKIQSDNLIKTVSVLLK